MDKYQVDIIAKRTRESVYFADLPSNELFIHKEALWMKVDEDSAYSFEVHLIADIHWLEEIEPAVFARVENVAIEDDDKWW